jgi:hypothetical protein
MVHQLESGRIQLTVLNFSSRSVAASVTSEHLTPGDAVLDMLTDHVFAEVDQDRTFTVSLEPHQGMPLLTVPATGAA